MKNFRVFLGNNMKFVFSAILIFLIPVFIIANTVWQIRTSQDNLDSELRQKALLSQSLLSSSITSSLGYASNLQTKIDQIKSENNEIVEISVLAQTDNGFLATASTNNQLLGVNFTGGNYLTAWSQDNPVASLVDDSKASNTRIYSVTSPVKDPLTNQKLGLLNLKLSLSDIDATTQKSVNLSLVLLSLTVLLVLLLLINYFKFFEYAVLFKKLQDVDKMKDDFVSISSHELKTPVAAIKGYLSMLFEGIAGKYDEKTKVHLQKIFDNVTRLDILVSELLDVSRIEQGRMQFDLQPTDAVKIVRESMNIFTDQAQTKKIKLYEKSLGKSAPKVFTDPDRLRQVVDNLISNAIKYTIKGEVCVSYDVQPNRLVIIVKDTGIGMSMSDQKNLFTKFYRIRNEKTVDVPGTGLGLWLAREIIIKMDGEISVKSTENQGSRFVISFPTIKENL